MFFRDLRTKPGVELSVTLAEAHIPVRMGHRDAEQVFSEPLSRQMAALGMGVVTGCKSDGCTMDVNSVTLYLGLTDPSRAGLQKVAKLLEHLAAPCGSSLRLTDAISDPLIFGTTEGLELSIETVKAPDADRRRALVRLCRDAMQEIAVSRGWSRRNEQTLFYFYGESYEAMRKNLERLLDLHPSYSSAALRRMA